MFLIFLRPFSRTGSPQDGSHIDSYLYSMSTLVTKIQRNDGSQLYTQHSQQETQPRHMFMVNIWRTPRNHVLTVENADGLPLRSGVGQNTAMHASPIVRNFSSVLILATFTFLPPPN